MINNYEYFLVLAEELNISRAAERLFLSHQNLSKYLKKLEEDYGIAFFERKPRLSLTYAGQLMLEALRKVELIDSNLSNQLEALHTGQSGELSIGTTEGRLRLLMPDVIHEFKRLYPGVALRMVSNRTASLLTMLADNKLDFAIIGASDTPIPALRYQVVLQERLYLVISDNLLREHFPDEYPICKETFSRGADLRLFGDVPFFLNYPKFSSRVMLDNHLVRIGASLKCVNETTAMDLHHLMSARDYAASFALTMYLPGIWQINNSTSGDSKLNVFPISGLYDTHPMAIASLKEKMFPEYAHAAMRIINRLCQYYGNIEI